MNGPPTTGVEARRGTAGFVLPEPSATGIDYAFVTDTSHLLQLEEPERCFALFEGFLADSGIAAAPRVDADSVGTPG